MKKIVFGLTILGLLLIFALVSAQDICETCMIEDPAMCPPECFDLGVCGDGICDPDEETTCPEDCEVATTTTTSSTTTTTVQPETTTTTIVGEVTTTTSSTTTISGETTTIMPEEATTTTILGETTTIMPEEATTTTILGETTTSPQPAAISPQLNTILIVIVAVIGCGAIGVLIYAKIKSAPKLT